MEKEIDIAAILKDKPNTKLWSPLYGDVFLSRVLPHGGIRVVCPRLDGTIGDEEKPFLDNGKFTLAGEVCLFPSSSMRDWSKFAWKKGDVLVYTEGEEPYYVIFEAFQDDEYTAFKSRYNFNGDNHWLQFNSQSSTNHFTKVSDDEAKVFIEKVEEHYNGKFNLSTLEIEKPQFKPMDWCLMRDFNETWKLCQFGFMEEGHATDNAPYCAVGGNWFNECIPCNDQTAHLLGTTDDWKGGEA